MLTSTFVLLRGIGPATERRLWQDGVADWSAFLGRALITGISPTRKGWYDEVLATAQSRLAGGSADFFRTCLKSREHWRRFTRSVIAHSISTLRPPGSQAAKP